MATRLFSRRLRALVFYVSLLLISVILGFNFAMESRENCESISEFEWLVLRNLLGCELNLLNPILADS